MAVIECKAVSLTVSRKKIMQQFNVCIRQGEFIGIFGANGSGKTSLLKAVLGLLRPDSGQLLIEGKVAQRGNRRIGYMPQLRERLSFHRLSGREYLAKSFNGFKWGLPCLNKHQKEKVKEVINLVHAENYVDRPYRCLSGGEKQRLAFAQVLLDEPALLLLDEPLTGLDPGQQEKMLMLIHNVQKQLNMTVLMTAHDFNPLLSYMHRLIYLARGKAAVGAIEEIVTSEKLSWLYDTPIEVFKHHDHLFVIHRALGINLYDFPHHPA